jgi:dTDP-4-dehydrorhamnose 3,5-epimerase
LFFYKTLLPGAFVVEVESVMDSRGLFARTWCQREFEAHGLNPCVRQCNTSFNEKRGTLRGMHYQAAPHAEVRLVRCSRGAVYDVIIDLRSDSPTFCRWVALELTADNRRSVYVPEGFAHGFQTLVDGSEVFYQMSEFFAPDNARGVRWDDPAFGIDWPSVDIRILSERDRGYPDFERSSHISTSPQQH